MNYTNKDKDKQGNPMPRGEILISGPLILKDYYRDEEKTNETVVDGWLLTGDVGAILPNGALKLIDRKKNIFKLS